MKCGRIISFLFVPLLVFGLCAQGARADVLMGTAVDNWNIEWTYSCATPLSFCGQTTTWYYGGSSAQSGSITHGQTSEFLGYTPYCAVGSQVRFVWKVSSEANFDYLRFLIDGVEKARISGEVDWQTVTFSIPYPGPYTPGYHVVRWQYIKDPSVSNGADAAWVDKVEIISGVTTYDVTIWGWDYIYGWQIPVPITRDGVSTGYYTPHTFTGVTGTHTYTVPITNSAGHPFSDWSTGSTSRTITVSSGGTYTARYRQSAAAALTVTTPNGGQSWMRGTIHTITWTSSGSVGAYVKIDLMKSGVLNKIIASSTPNDGSQSWTIPSTQTLGTDYKIRITSTTNPSITDTSNSNFAITSGTGILTVTTPNGGQTWRRGTVHTITWSKSGSTGSYVKIELLKAGVLNRVIVSSTANDGSHSWTIPSTQTIGTNYKIRITSTSNPSITDTSNSNFAITA